MCVVSQRGRSSHPNHGEVIVIALSHGRVYECHFGRFHDDAFLRVNDQHKVQIPGPEPGLYVREYDILSYRPSTSSSSLTVAPNPETL